MSIDDASLPPSIGLGATLRLLVSAGASDQVIENFLRLHANEISGAPQTPYVEIGPAIVKAAEVAALRVADQILRSASNVPSLSPASTATAHPNPTAIGKQTPPTTARQSIRPSLSEQLKHHDSTRPFIYRLTIGGQRTSISVSHSLLRSATHAFGDAGTREMIESIAYKTPQSARNRSAYVSAAIAKALTDAAAFAGAPDNVQ